MKLLISGYRKYENYDVIKREMLCILQLRPNEPHTIIHGGCPSGVDKIANQIALELKCNIEVYPADWQLGKRAGPLRNEKMITDGKPDCFLLFLSKQSKGTKNMLELFTKYQISDPSLKCTVIEID